jgi:hypothetical protein
MIAHSTFLLRCGGVLLACPNMATILEQNGIANVRSL